MRAHWREYAAEAAAIGLFMVSAAVFTVLLEHPDSPVREALPDDFTRRGLMGLAMGATAAAIIYSPLGARSGAHMNPSVTAAFLRLGRIGAADAAAYITAQCAGAVLGTWAAFVLLGGRFADPSVNFVQTRPGPGGLLPAALGEFAISFATLSILLAVSARASTMRATGLVAGVVVMANIVFEAPLSGMSMNPARSLGPALVAGDVSGLWLYLVVPPLGMLLAAEAHRRWPFNGDLRRGLDAHGCAKLNHSARVRCIFCES